MVHNRSWFTLAGLLFVVMAIHAPLTALAQLPRTRLFSLFPPGGSAGSAQHVKIVTGTDLDGVRGLLFSHDGITAAQKFIDPTPTWPLPKPVENEFIVTIDPDVPPGVYDVRAFGSHGVSNARSFVVSDLQELVEEPTNASFDQATELEIGSVVYGTAKEGTSDYFKFEAKQGQRVLIDCYARRIDSRMDGTLVLYDADGRELKRDRDTHRRDPLIDFRVPADGVYVVQIYDFLHEGGDEHFYRLAISTGPHVAFIFPPAAMPGTQSTYTIYGRNLPGSSPAPGVTIHGPPLEKLSAEIAVPAIVDRDTLPIDTVVAPAESTMDAMRYQLTTPYGTSNPIRLGIATAPVVVEKEPNDDPSQAQAVAPFCEIAGRFDDRRDMDWFTFDAKKDAVYYMEVYSHRLGLPTDPYLLIQQVSKDPDGQLNVKDIAEVDDPGGYDGSEYYNSRTADPIYRFVAPEDGTYRVLVRDLNASPRGDLYYRLAIRPPQPDFRLVAFSVELGKKDNVVDKYESRPLLLRRGGAEKVEVLAFRRDGFDGPIDLSAEFLPLGVRCGGSRIPIGRDRAELMFRAGDDAKEWFGHIRIVGRARIGDAWVERAARGGEVQWGGKPNESIIESRMVSRIAMAVSGNWRFPFTLKLADSEPVILSSTGKVKVPMKVIRRDGFGQSMSLHFDDLPDEIRSKPITIDGKKSDGELELELHVRDAPEQYALVLMADTKVNVPRDPGAVAAAAKSKETIDGIAAQAATAAEQSEKARQDAEKKVNETTAQLEQANGALEKAKQADSKAIEEARSAADDAAAASEASTKDSENVSLQDALEVARREAAAASSRAATAAAVKEAAIQARAAADQAQRDATKVKTMADRTASEAKDRAKNAEQAKKAAEEAVNNAAKYGKPEEKAVSTAAMVIGLKVTLLPTPFVQAEKVLNVDTESYAFPRTDRRRYLVTVYEP